MKGKFAHVRNPGLFSIWYIFASCFWAVSMAKVLQDTCAAGTTVAHSNRNMTNPCTGAIGDECVFECLPGYIPVGRHFCQDYRVGAEVFIDHAFFGGRCDRLCPATSKPCGVGTTSLRVNATDDTGVPCLHTQCMSADAALLNLAQGNYEVWLAALNSLRTYHRYHLLHEAIPVT